MTPDPARWIWAALAIGLWLLLIAGIVWTRKHASRLADARAEAMADGKNAVLVAFASQTGTAEQLAWMTGEALSGAGTPARVVSLSDLDILTLREAGRILVVASTTGEGDAPDSLSGFCRRHMAMPVALEGVTYGLLALGDRSYDEFCGFGRALDDWLQASGAVPMFDRIEVDDGDPNAIAAWRARLNDLANSAIRDEWVEAGFTDWRLIQRDHLNPGSPGAEVWHLSFVPEGLMPKWVAGDIAEIAMPGTNEPGRDYSLASVPSDGRAEFIVRRIVRPDGTPGVASQLLTRDLALRQTIPVRIRRNSAFHGPAPETPLILIGNGTGLAGLRAHWRARADHADKGETWLMFGERTSRHDAFLATELDAVLAEGVLNRIDRTYSRDEGDGRYVQALISQHADDLRGWVRNGATILVCGSAEGMAQSVDAALNDVLGAAVFEGLKDTGRYRRDVY